MTSVYQSRAAVVAAAFTFLIVASSASGQAFNIDFGITSGVPSNSHGGTYFHGDLPPVQPGHWNAINEIDNPVVLSDLSGTPTSVTLDCDLVLVEAFESDRGSTDDERLLFDAVDFAIIWPLMPTLTFNNLQNGQYVIEIMALPKMTDVGLTITTGSRVDKIKAPIHAAAAATVNDLWYGTAYVILTVEVTDGTLAILFDAEDPLSAHISGIVLTPYTGMISNAVAPGGDLDDPATWDNSNPPDAAGEVGEVDGGDPNGTTVTVDSPATPAAVFVSPGDLLEVETGGDLSADLLVVDGGVNLSDSSSIGGDAAVLSCDDIAGSGVVTCTTGWQNWIQSATPGTPCRIGAGILCESPAGTRGEFKSDVWLRGTCTADGGEWRGNSIFFENNGVCTATNNGGQDFDNCTIDNRLGRFEAESGGVCSFTSSGLEGGVVVARVGGQCNYLNSALLGVTFETEDNGVHVFRGVDNVLLPDGPIMPRIEVGSRVELGLDGHVNVYLDAPEIENAGAIEAISDPGNWTKNIVVRAQAVDLVGGGEVRLNNPSNHRIFGETGSEVLVNVDNTFRGAGRFGLNALQIENQHLIEADLPFLPLRIDPNGGGFTQSVNAVCRATNDGVLELFDGDFVGGLFVADGGTVSVQNATFSDAVLEAVNGGLFGQSATGWTAFDGTIAPVVIAPATSVPIINALYVEGDVDNQGEIVLRGRHNAGLGAVLQVQDNFALRGDYRMEVDVTTANAQVAGFGGSFVVEFTDDAALEGAGRVQSSIQLQVRDNAGVRANVDGYRLRLECPIVDNDAGSFLGAENGGELNFWGTTINQQAGSLVQVIGPDSTVLFEFCTVNGGGIETDADGAVELNNTVCAGVDFDGNVIFTGSSNTDSDLDNSRTTSVVGTLTTPATCSLNGGGTLDVSGILRGVPATTLNIVDHTVTGDGGRIRYNEINNGGNVTSVNLIVDQANATLNNDNYFFIPNAGLFTMTGASVFNNNGGATFGGAGTANVNTFNNAAALFLGGGGGALAGAGAEIGELTINGSFVQDAFGTLEVDLAGLTAGTEHDQLNISGNATLGGELVIRPANGFHWQVGQSFTILTAGTIFNEFDMVTCDGMFDITYNEDSVVLTATHTLVPGDLDCSGTVSVMDLLQLLSEWGPCPGGPIPCAADIDGNGAVNVSDLLTMLANWG